jgi:hypothetical protein
MTAIKKNFKLQEMEGFRKSIFLMENALHTSKRHGKDERFVDRLERCRSWLVRAYQALTDEELEFGFISLWAAFNSLYGIVEKEAFDKSLARYLSELVKADVHQIESLLVNVERQVNLKGLLTNPFLVEKKLE